MALPTIKEAEELLHKYVTDKYQILHAEMVAYCLAEYAKKLGQDEQLWYVTGLLHDLDYFQYPDQHPQQAVSWFKDWQFPEELIHAVAAHALRSTEMPNTLLANMLVAVDELTGLLYAYFMMRPEGFRGMEFKSYNKKFKDKKFAAKVNREEIMLGVTGAKLDFIDHINFMIAILNKFPNLSK